MANVPSGHKNIRTRDLILNRIDPTKTDGTRENVSLQPILSCLNVVEVAVDATAGTVTTSTTFPDTALIIASTFDVTTAFTDGTSVTIGIDTDVDSLHTLTTPSVGAVVGAGADIGAIAGGALKVTVTDAYTTGAGTLKVFWLDAASTDG